MNRMDFSAALQLLRRDQRMRRISWREHEWIARVPGMLIAVPAASAVRRHMVGPALDLNMGAHVVIHTAGGTFSPGWTPTQADMFAEDWEAVDPE